jgi:hypothetical protein
MPPRFAVVPPPPELGASRPDIEHASIATISKCIPASRTPSAFTLSQLSNPLAIATSSRDESFLNRGDVAHTSPSTPVQWDCQPARRVRHRMHKCSCSPPIAACLQCPVRRSAAQYSVQDAGLVDLCIASDCSLIDSALKTLPRLSGRAEANSNDLCRDVFSLPATELTSPHSAPPACDSSSELIQLSTRRCGDAHPPVRPSPAHASAESGASIAAAGLLGSDAAPPAWVFSPSPTPVPSPGSGESEGSSASSAPE